jgi:hypothetical protein
MSDLSLDAPGAPSGGRFTKETRTGRSFSWRIIFFGFFNIALEN